MDKTKKELVKDIVYKFAELSKITDTKMCDNLVEKLLNLDTDDSIDTILVSLNSLLHRKILQIVQYLKSSMIYSLHFPHLKYSIYSLYLSLSSSEIHHKDDEVDDIVYIYIILNCL